MARDKIDIGRSGENKAAAFLKKNGYSIIEKNYKNYLGEIDIIALDKNVVCFIEVRSRRSPAKKEDIFDSIRSDKKMRLSRIALCFLKEKQLMERSARFDIVGVALDENKDNIFLLKNAFELPYGYV